ncbi:MAG: hypothetical protein EBR40_09095 [Proteobacteria bacterium]|nr:hypothetical protein [Pseudomonadota bacterium]
MRSMRQDQYDALAAKLNDPNDAGFSANPRKGGAPPRSRYMVGQRDVEEGTHAMPSTGTDIRVYADSNAPTLSRPERYLGGWVEDEDAYLDVPKGFPRTPQGEVDARKSTLENSQRAYGVVDSKGRYAGTVYSPFHPAYQYEIQAQDSDRDVWAEMPLHSAQFKRGRSIPLKDQSFS